jgi:hypothetical protein
MSREEFVASHPPAEEAFSKEDLAKIEELQAEAAAEPAPDAERPEWLPEKFTSPEAMAQAYAELEGKLGAPEKEEAPKDAEPSGDSNLPEGFWDQAAQAYQETGGITDDQLKTMTDMGIPQPMIDTYMAGLEALVAQQTAAVYEAVGGEAEYQAMMDWAQKNMSAEDQAAHNRAVEAGDAAAAQLAIRGLHAQYKNQTSSPHMVTGKAPQFGGLEPFADRSQVVEAMRDPRYRKSDAYRQEVERRLAVTNL